MVIRFFFYTLNTIYKLQIAHCACAFDLDNNLDHKKDWCGIISYINCEMGEQGMASLIPGNYFRYNLLGGAGASHRYDTAAEILGLENDDPE